MEKSKLQQVPQAALFDLAGKTAVVTGGGGVLCSAMCRALAAAGVKVAVLDLSLEAAERVAAEMQHAAGSDRIGSDRIGSDKTNSAIALPCNVLERTTLEDALDQVLEAFGRVDILINGAGGNKREATTSAEVSFFDLSPEALRWVFDLNLLGTLLPSQVFGQAMASSGDGCILNISSMNAFRPLTRIVAYSAAKAAVSNFTQWLAVYLAQEVSPNIRVNALAPGFFAGEQNRALLFQEDGSLTARGQQILAHTPQGRFGQPDDLLGAMFWLLSPGARFVTGIVVPVDGGFSAYSGV